MKSTKMKFLSSLLLASATFCRAKPHHRHHHIHVENRVPAPVAENVYVPGPTVIVYELNGHVISGHEVEEGIKNGTLIWAEGGIFSSSSSTSAPQTAAPVAPIYSAIPAESVAISRTEPSSVAAAPGNVATKASNPDDWSGGASGTDADFPDGQLDCSTFPSAYGAMNIDWLNLGGWIGIQSPGSPGPGGFSNIETIISSLCTGSDCCGEGMYCSYACAPGYQKSQWPAIQGSTGQSIGGILCQNGKLHLTNKALSTKLCMQGTQAVHVQVQNAMGQSAAVCRTDYPGTEGETIPLSAEPGTTNNLTCPDAANYYNWDGMHTSAQYYVNPAGVTIQEACQWGSSSNDWGNFAPLNLGVGYSGGMAWLSIFQNLPTTSKQLDFSVELVGEDGGYDNLNGRCKYQNGQYCSGDDYSSCSSDGAGCTVAVSYGSATFVFSG